MSTRAVLLKSDRSTIAFAILAAGAGAGAGILAASVANPLGILILIAAPIAALATFARLEWGLLAFVFITYTRMSDVFIHSHGLPSIAQPLQVVLLGAILVRRWWYGERPTGWARPAQLLFGYALVGALSLVYAADSARSQNALIDYVKDATVALSVVLLLRQGSTLRRVIWALLAAGILMGSISVYQQLTGHFESDFLGFGHAPVKNIVDNESDYRVAGPIGDPNFYAQVMLVLVPLALDRLWNERSRLLRSVAGWAFVVCALTVIFTYSRGGFLGLVVVLAIMLMRHPPRPLAVAITVAVAVPLLQFVPQDYVDRIRTLTDALPFAGGEVSEDSSLRGRLSESTAGWMMFSDHPLFGVGLNNYPVYYQQYSRQLGLDQRREARSPHSLYLQIAAEMGWVGLCAFGFVLWVMFRRLRRAYLAFSRAQRPETAGMVMALCIGLIGYLTAALFLHAAYPRFFWLLVGIALTLPQVADHELRPAAQRESERRA